MRLIIASNRLPVTLKFEDGKRVFHPSAGGLATGLSSLDPSIERLWFGFPGATGLEPTEKVEVTEQLLKQKMVPVFIDEQVYAQYYEGFSNSTIWPLFHYFPQYTDYDEACWKSYQDANTRFFEVIAANIQDGDVVWVHDYQLMLLPGMLRAQFPHMSIGFFLHIPFPSYELFRTLTWRTDLLNGVLGADLIGFHTFDYMRHFLSAVQRLLGYEHQFGRLEISGRCIHVDAMPMGIDYEKYATPYSNENSTEEVQTLIEMSKNVKIVLSVDRLDYSKGIPMRIRGFEKFLRENKEWQGKVTLLLVVVPSRDTVAQYSQLKDEIELLVGRIHGELGTIDWTPIHYFYRPFQFNSLMALYQLSHVALITPLRDGMNLVAKEFVAGKETSGLGVLILSEMAGAASELDEALHINPCDVNSIVVALQQALTMSEKEQSSRLRRMQRTLKANNVKEWAKGFIEAQIEQQNFQQQKEARLLTSARRDELVKNYKSASKRLVLLDYGGTLVGFTKNPVDSKPDKFLIDTLKKLSEQPGTQVVLVSGRDSNTLSEWFSGIGLDMIGEHGSIICKKGQWRTIRDGISNDWKKEVLPLLEKLVLRTPGSHVEVKEYTLAWHFRGSEKELSENHLREIRQQLTFNTSSHQLHVMKGNRVVEVLTGDINKGKAAKVWLEDKDWDMIIALGDDDGDESIFNALPESAYTIKVGIAESQTSRSGANYKVRSVHESRELVSILANV